MRYVIYHVFARKFGWTPKQVDKMKCPALAIELALIGEDVFALYHESQSQR